MSSVQGRLQLRFANDAQMERTVLHIEDQRPPLRVIRAFPQGDGGALVHLHNISGGMLGGDDLRVDVSVERGAIAQITTTGATRIYRRRDDAGPAIQHTEIAVASGGLLEFLPDAIIPFAGAQYHQTTHITLEKDAGLFAWEILAPGREAHDECFDYERVQMHLDICVEDRPILLERADLEPHERPLEATARMGPYRYLASFYCCRAGLSAQKWLSLESQLAEIARSRSMPGERVWGVSALIAHGLVARGLSIGGHGLDQDLLAFWSAAKRALYGADAVPPRKVR